MNTENPDNAQNQNETGADDENKPLTNSEEAEKDLDLKPKTDDEPEPEPEKEEDDSDPKEDTFRSMLVSKLHKANILPQISGAQEEELVKIVKECVEKVYN